MRRLVAALALVVGGAAFVLAAPAQADPVSSTQTRDICIFIEKTFDPVPGGYWYLYSYRTVHLFGGPIHVTQCAYRDYLGRPVHRCYQLAWNLPPGSPPAQIEQYPENPNDDVTPCW